MANGDVDVTEGTGLKVGTYTISEDAVTRHLQRVALNNSAGTGLATGTGLIGADVLRIALATDSPGILTEGQIDKANSVPVTVATDQEAVGVQARTLRAAPTAVLAGSAVMLPATRHGLPFFLGGHPNTVRKAFRILDSDGAQTNMVLSGTIASGTAVVLTSLYIRADQANSGNVAVQIGFGTSAVPTPALAGVEHLVFDEDLAAGDGHQEGNGTGIIAIGASDMELRLTCEDPVGGALYVALSYHTCEI